MKNPLLRFCLAFFLSALFAGVSFGQQRQGAGLVKQDEIKDIILQIAYEEYRHVFEHVGEDAGISSVVERRLDDLAGRFAERYADDRHEGDFFKEMARFEIWRFFEHEIEIEERMRERRASRFEQSPPVVQKVETEVFQEPAIEKQAHYYSQDQVKDMILQIVHEEFRHVFERMEEEAGIKSTLEKRLDDLAGRFAQRYADDGYEGSFFKEMARFEIRRFFEREIEIEERMRERRASRFEQSPPVVQKMEKEVFQAPVIEKQAHYYSQDQIKDMILQLVHEEFHHVFERMGEEAGIKSTLENRLDDLAGRFAQRYADDGYEGSFFKAMARFEIRRFFEHEIEIEERMEKERPQRTAKALSEAAAVNETDSLALVALYNSTDGDNWTNNTGWFDGPVDSWHGITVEGGKVAEIVLRDNNLAGALPAELGTLGELRRLDLGNPWNGTNEISGEIPAELGDLTYLELIDLSRNQLTGTIPPELGNLGNLQRLDLSWNQLTGVIPSELGNLGNLEYFDLSWNQLTGVIPSELGNLGNLRQLYLESLSLIHISEPTRPY